jgi:hypothetical protein
VEFANPLKELNYQEKVKDLKSNYQKEEVNGLEN